MRDSPIINGINIENSGITVVPIIVTWPVVSGFKSNETIPPSLTNFVYLICSSSNNITYGPPNNSSDIVIVTNLFSSFTWKLRLFSGWLKLKSLISESVTISTSNLFSSQIASLIIFDSLE